MSARAIAEWHPLRRVVVRPPGMEAFFGLLEPYASLYERVFSLRHARREHEELVETLRSEFGVQVQIFDQLLLQSAGRHADVARSLLEKAEAAVTFAGPGAERARREFRANAHLLDGDQLLQTLVIRPEIRFEARRVLWIRAGPRVELAEEIGKRRDAAD